jgi:hypothetical protein
MKNSPSFLPRFIRTLVLIELVIFAAIAAIGLAAGWSTSAEYTSGLVIIGVVLIILGAMTMQGYWGVTRELKRRQIDQNSGATEFRTARKLPPATKLSPATKLRHSPAAARPVKQVFNEFAQQYAFILYLFSAGVISLLAGILVQVVFP